MSCDGSLVARLSRTRVSQEMVVKPLPAAIIHINSQLVITLLLLLNHKSLFVEFSANCEL